MSNLHNRLGDAMKDALRAKHSLRKLTLRNALASIKQAEVDGQTQLDDMDVTVLIQREISAHQEAMADARRACRDDLLSELQERITILQEFIPNQMSRNEISTLAETIIAEVGANVPGQIGEVMKLLMPQLRGRADGKLVSSIVSELLTASCQPTGKRP